jgi:intracellular proteinase inhibitor BsuPI/copper amine oxidase-like protein
MMTNHLRWIAGLGVLLAAAGVARPQEGQPIAVYVNEERLRTDGLLLAGVGRTVLPMRVLFESLGAQVEWDPAERTVYAWKADRTGVRLALGEASAQTLRMSRDPRPGDWGQVTGTYRLDAPPMLLERRVYVPLRFASEALNADVRFVSFRPAVFIRTEAVAGSREEKPPVPRPREPGPEEIASALELSLKLDAQRFDRDQDAIPIEFVVRNTSDRPVVIPFRSGQEIDIEVVQEGKVVWNWAHGRMFTQALTRLTLQPGETETFSVRWSLKANNGRTVPPGRYLVRGILTAAFERPQIAVERRITIAD